MRIALVSETWLPCTDGVVTRLTATVKELRRAGHEVMVVAPYGAEPEYHGAAVHGVPTVSVPFIYGGRPWGLPVPWVLRYLDDFAPDVVHVVNPVLLGIAGVLAARMRRLPIVASYHTDVPRYAGFYRLGWAAGGIWRVLRALHNSAEVNLATSAAAMQQLREHRVERVSLWRRGVDLELFHPDRARADVPWAGRSDRPVALYVGRLAEEKHLHLLDPLVRSGTAQLVLVGEGPDRRRLEEHFLGEPVTFTGALYGEQLAAAYASADVFAFPSTTETLGLVLLEALASGLPIVAAESPASGELLATSPVARLFPRDRPEIVPALVEELLADASGADADGADPEARAKRVRLAREQVEAYSWPAATRGLITYYEQAIAGGPPRAAGAQPAVE